MSQPILQAHCQSRTSPPARQSFVKELAKPTQEKLFLNNFPTLQKNKKRHPQPDTNRQENPRTMTAKTQSYSDFQTRWTRTPAANSGFASCGVKCLNSSSVFQFNFSAGLTVLCPEIPARTQSRKTLAVMPLELPLLTCFC